MKSVLVSLVSDQTIPNVEFIKEKRSETDEYLFLTTNSMEQKGVKEWIMTAAEINEDKAVDFITIDPFSFSDIKQQLEGKINDNDHYIVNLTGGTKVTSLAVFEFFKIVNSEMYYLTGRGKYIKVHPGQQKRVYDLSIDISLKEYLAAYGFSIKNQSKLLHDFSQAKKILSYFKNRTDDTLDNPVLEKLQEKRSKKNTLIDDIEGLKEFMERIGYTTQNVDKITKYEVRYLTGEWLEEYLYYFLCENFDINESNIGLGMHLLKNNTPNEFDVLLMKNNKLYLFECKTSIYKRDEKSQTFINETIYKSDSLRNKFGLFTQTTLFTLSDTDSESLASNRKRADASRVKLIGGKQIFSDSLYDELKSV